MGVEELIPDVGHGDRRGLNDGEIGFSAFGRTEASTALFAQAFADWSGYPVVAAPLYLRYSRFATDLLDPSLSPDRKSVV